MEKGGREGEGRGKRKPFLVFDFVALFSYHYLQYIPFFFSFFRLRFLWLWIEYVSAATILDFGLDESWFSKTYYELER